MSELRWEITGGTGGTIIELAGDVDEHASFAPLTASLAGRVVLDLAGVRRINSTGVRTWIDFMSAMPEVTALVFRRCSPPVITQVNMVANFRGRAEVESFFAPYVCEACGAEHDQLIDVAELRGRGALPEIACAACGGATTLDDVADRYLAFLSA